MILKTDEIFAINTEKEFVCLECFGDNLSGVTFNEVLLDKEAENMAQDGTLFFCDRCNKQLDPVAL